MDSKKKLSGSEYRKRRLEKEAATLQNAQKISAFFNKGLRQSFVHFISFISSYEFHSKYNYIVLLLKLEMLESAESSSKHPIRSDAVDNNSHDKEIDEEPIESSLQTLRDSSSKGFIS